MSSAITGDEPVADCATFPRPTRTGIARDDVLGVTSIDAEPGVGSSTFLRADGGAGNKELVADEFPSVGNSGFTESSGITGVTGDSLEGSASESTLLLGTAVGACCCLRPISLLLLADAEFLLSSLFDIFL